MGFYECVFQDLYIQKSETMLVANGFSYCLATGFRGLFGRNAISVAIGSSNSLISNFIGSQVYNDTVDSEGVGTSYSLVNIHEGSARTSP